MKSSNTELSPVALVGGVAGGVPMDDLGEEVSPGLYQAEIDYLKKYEWAKNMDDILWRRSKLGIAQLLHERVSNEGCSDDKKSDEV